ncbi:hypothetical protein Milano_100 [Agrobacterium phage Milano]|nr:hypothetical protein Milano_100 [Agrobacterium phage Milano]
MWSPTRHVSPKPPCDRLSRNVDDRTCARHEQEVA